jgi:hypothetical protein
VETRCLTKVRLVCSHRWQYDQLTSKARPPSTFSWAEENDDPDVIIFIVPPWPDPEAPENLFALRARDVRRLYLFSQADDGIFWAPGVFAAASNGAPTSALGGFYMHPDQVTPGAVGPLIDKHRAADVDLLWSFTGSVRTAPVLRGALVGLNDSDSLSRDSATPWGMAADARQRLQTEYVSTLVRSRFIACPRGYAPATQRLFEAMRAGRAPVVLSDDWRPPPFVDWDRCCIRVPEAKVSQLPAILREREQEAAEIGQRARSVWEARFSPEGMVHQLVDSCLMLDESGWSTRRRIGIAARAIPTTAMRRRVRGDILTRWRALPR